MAVSGWLLCLMVLCCCCWSHLQVNGYYQVMDCCLRTSSHPIPSRLVRDYREQHIQEGCSVQAVIFVTMRRRQLCAPPQAVWVKRLKKQLDRHHKRQPPTSS